MRQLQFTSGILVGSHTKSCNPATFSKNCVRYSKEAQTRKCSLIKTIFVLHSRKRTFECLDPLLWQTTCCMMLCAVTQIPTKTGEQQQEKTRTLIFFVSFLGTGDCVIQRSDMFLL